MPFLKSRIYLNADRSRVVDEDSPDAYYLLGNEGTEVSDDEAKRLKLKTSDKPVETLSANPPGSGGVTITKLADTEVETEADATDDAPKSKAKS